MFKIKYPNCYERENSLSFCCINFNFRSPRDESCSPAEPQRVFNESYVRFQQTHPEELCALSQALVAHILPISFQSTRKQQLLSLRRALVMRTTCTCCHTPSPPATRKRCQHITHTIRMYSIAHLGHCRNAHGRLRA